MGEREGGKVRGAGGPSGGNKARSRGAHRIRWVGGREGWEGLGANVGTKRGGGQRGDGQGRRVAS